MKRAARANATQRQQKKNRLLRIFMNDPSTFPLLGRFDVFGDEMIFCAGLIITRQLHRGIRSAVDRICAWKSKNGRVPSRTLAPLGHKGICPLPILDFNDTTQNWPRFTVHELHRGFNVEPFIIPCHPAVHSSWCCRYNASDFIESTVKRCFVSVGSRRLVRLFVCDGCKDDTVPKAQIAGGRIFAQMIVEAYDQTRCRVTAIRRGAYLAARRTRFLIEVDLAYVRERSRQSVCRMVPIWRW